MIFVLKIKIKQIEKLDLRKKGLFGKKIYAMTSGKMRKKYSINKRLYIANIV